MSIDDLNNENASPANPADDLHNLSDSKTGIESGFGAVGKFGRDVGSDIAGSVHGTGDKLQTAVDYFFIIIGNLLFAASVNLIIVPIGLYNGGFTGFAQLIRAFLIHMGVTLPTWIDFTGIFNFALNVPLLIHSYKVLGKEFTLSNLFSIGLASAFLAFIPIPKAPLFDDYLTACVVGGVVGGFGIGLTLRGGGSSGGADIIAMCMIKKRPNASVGKLNMLINFIVYGICLVAFNVQTAAYSFIYAGIKAAITDKTHTQNINMQVIIVTKEDGIDHAINEQLGRGVTTWEGKGAYTGDNVHILMAAVSKYEINHLREVVLGIDPHAFLISTEGEGISGNFKKHRTKDFF